MHHPLRAGNSSVKVARSSWRRYAFCMDRMGERSRSNGDGEGETERKERGAGARALGGFRGKKKNRIGRQPAVAGYENPADAVSSSTDPLTP